jgi:hypothetical protein
VSHDPGGVIFVLLFRNFPGAVPILLLTLLVSVYLTVIELREIRPSRKWWIWWLSLVALTNFVGYLALRVYSAIRRRNDARA